MTTSQIFFWKLRRKSPLQTTAYKQVNMSGVRSYNPSVRVGNWCEDLSLEEDFLKDFIEKKERGELLIDKTKNLYAKILSKINIAKTRDGYIRYGDIICLYNPETDTVLSVHVADSKIQESEHFQGPCGVSASKILQPCARNAFVIKSCDDSKDGDPLLHGQHFLLSTLPGVGGDIKLQSDTATFMKCAKKSRHQEILLNKDTSYPSHWEILHMDPRERLETEGLPVKANEKVLINHCKTNQRLTVLPEFASRTQFGLELEVVAKTKLDSHRAEQPVNHWMLVADVEDSEND